MNRMWRKVRPITQIGNDGIIELSNGMLAYIDAADISLVMEWNWSAAISKSKIYAERGVTGEKNIKLHNSIMPSPPEFIVDHRDGDGLNCRRANLRFATLQQNTWNRQKGAANTSGFKGVCLRGDRGTWLAMIGRRKIGTFKNIEDAARAYDVEALKMWGEFAVLNFPADRAAVPA